MQLNVKQGKTQLLDGVGFFFLTLLSLTLWQADSSAQSSNSLSYQEKIALAPTAQYYEDRSGSLTLQDVISESFRTNFLDSDSEQLHFGITSSAYWIKFSMDWSQLSPAYRYILELGPPRHVGGIARGGVDLYILDDLNEIQFQYQMGSYTNTRELKTLMSGFAINVDPQIGQHYLLRVTTARSLILPISLWEESAFFSKEQTSVSARGVVYGILIAMALYNLFLFISIREFSFLFYVLSIATQLGFIFVDSKHLRFLTGDMLQASWLVTMAERLVYPALIITTLLFQRSLLRVWEYNRQLDRIILATLSSCLVIVLATFFTSEKPYQYLFLATALITIPLALLTNIDAIKRGVNTATVHLAGTALFLLGASILLGRQLWSQFPDNSFTANAYTYGVLAQTMLLSLGLAFRYNQIKQEKEDAQQMAIQNLMRSERVKDDLLANVSHELRTPLFGINGLAETALSEYREGKGSTTLLVRNLELIQTSGERLTKLVNDLLDFSSTRDSSTHVRLRPVDLQSMLTLVIAISNPLIGKKDIELRTVIADDLPLVDADENRLQQILINLISNAIKFTYSGEVVVSAALASDKMVNISVQDTGIGIHKSDHETIFRSFEKAAAPGIQGGVGLGLSLARRMVEMHGSDLSIESDLDMGSIFSFQLRVSSDQTRAIPKPALNRTLIRRADFSKQPLDDDTPKLRSDQEITILVVDDDEINRTLMGQQLDEFNVIKCSNGFDAITIVDENKPDLILLDLMMPGLNGYEVCQKLRQRFNQIELPIILVTAKNHLEDLTMGFNTGANDYLAKPYYHQELKSRVANQLKLSYLHRIHDDNVKLRSQIEQYIQADAELRSSRFRLQQVLESLAAGFIAIEYPGKIFSLNQRAAELLGTDKQALLGSRIDSLLSSSAVNSNFRQTIEKWENGEVETETSMNIEIEVIYPYNSASKANSSQVTFHCKLNLFTTEEGTGVLFLEDTEIPLLQSSDDNTYDIVKLVSLLGQAQHNIRRIGSRLSVLTPQEVSLHPELLEKLMGIDKLVKYIDEKLPEVSSEGEYRQQLVTLMRSSLHTWEVTTQKSKIELAEESNIWAVSIDDGRLRTRTFDRYLRLEQLPRIPRWREVVRTAYFVLSNPAIEPETRTSLELELEKTKSILKKAAIS